jgi:hypothetical protein
MLILSQIFTSEDESTLTGLARVGELAEALGLLPVELIRCLNRLDADQMQTPAPWPNDANLRFRAAIRASPAG